MLIYYHPNHLAHDQARLHQPDDPHSVVYYSEVAQRGPLIHDAIVAAGLGVIQPPQDFGLAPIVEVHRHEMVAFLQTAHERFVAETGRDVALPETFSIGGRPRRKPVSVWGLLGYYCFDIGSPVFAGTWEAAYGSAQTAVAAAAAIASGERLVYALCRPPGHHAAADMFGGFCYLNNAAIASQWLVEKGQRIAILDLDYHHGNGTQEIFYGRADVLTCSIHADPLHEYPFYWGFADEYGIGAGENYNFNFPLPLGTQEAAYLVALDIALRRIRAFVPDCLVVSFGADTLENDPVGGFKLSVESYGRIAAQIAALDLPTLVIQEGGYLLPQLGSCVLSFLQGLKTG
ncbi:MAG: histone deacetylase family protein [Anaerolineae bacterium]|nr:histone deacetylase family protein [Anaerolineae bacterium]